MRCTCVFPVWGFTTMRYEIWSYQTWYYHVRCSKMFKIIWSNIYSIIACALVMHAWYTKNLLRCTRWYFSFHPSPFCWLKNLFPKSNNTHNDTSLEILKIWNSRHPRVLPDVYIQFVTPSNASCAHQYRLGHFCAFSQ